MTRLVTLLEFSAVGDADSLGGSSRARAERLHLPHHIHPVFNAAEHHVPPVQPGKHILIIITFTGNESRFMKKIYIPLCFDCAYEELGSVGVWSGVSHGQDT